MLVVGLSCTRGVHWAMAASRNRGCSGQRAMRLRDLGANEK